MTKRGKKTVRATVIAGLVLAATAGGLYGYKAYLTHRYCSTPTYKTGRTAYRRPATTEVYVLGTTHTPAAPLNADSLYNALETIKPNVILYEFDSTAFDGDMRLKSRFRSVYPPFLARLNTNEGPAAAKYVNFNPFAAIRPYEWALRNQWHREQGTLTVPGQVFNRLDSLDQQGKLTPAQRAILRTYYDLSKRLNAYADSSLERINTPQQDSLAEKRQHYQYHLIRQVVDEHEALKPFRDFYRLNETYWDLRNKAMAANVCRYIGLYPQSRIVVLNGFFHRYYLRRELAARQKDLGFVLLDLK